mmetsp:Transcript_9117/g.35579  ORF Transcript_9117/g.35579 Transcript_9117/m.35579 type:complete len:204 (-) Transcript_9117:3818-4429(-)
MKPGFSGSQCVRSASCCSRKFLPMSIALGFHRPLFSGRSSSSSDSEMSSHTAAAFFFRSLVGSASSPPHSLIFPPPVASPWVVFSALFGDDPDSTRRRSIASASAAALAGSEPSRPSVLFSSAVIVDASMPIRSRSASEGSREGDFLGGARSAPAPGGGACFMPMPAMNPSSDMRTGSGLGPGLGGAGWSGCSDGTRTMDAAS